MEENKNQKEKRKYGKVNEIKSEELRKEVNDPVVSLLRIDKEVNNILNLKEDIEQIKQTLKDTQQSFYKSQYAVKNKVYNKTKKEIKEDRETFEEISNILLNYYTVVKQEQVKVKSKITQLVYVYLNKKLRAIKNESNNDIPIDILGDDEGDKNFALIAEKIQNMKKITEELQNNKNQENLQKKQEQNLQDGLEQNLQEGLTQNFQESLKKEE